VSFKLGIIARSDNTGLGNQTKELVDMLNPAKIMLINSFSFNKNKQHPEWYHGYDWQYVRGFPNTSDISTFLKGLDVVMSCETFYNKRFISYARQKNIKTILQYNYEFLDNLQNPNLDLPDVLLAPSLWGFEAVTEAFGSKSKVIHLPPPTSQGIFQKAREVNLESNHKRILHVGGKAAHMDRNGTNTVIEMLKYSKEDYELVIKSQSSLNIDTSDSRLSFDTKSPENREDLYLKFDAMILPRRYAGLCLPMNESLMSALPVFMTDISPNYNILPKDWLVKSTKINRFKARTEVDVYNADAKLLANLVDEYMSKNTADSKKLAYDIGYSNFSPDLLKNKYIDIINK
jgi:hypothetical protein